MLKPTPNITDREQGKNCPIAIRNSKISLKQRRLWSWSVLSSCFFNSVTFSTDAEMQPLTEGTARNCQTPDYYKINGSTVLLPQQLLQQTLYSITLSPLALGPLKVNMPSFLPVHTHKAWRLWLNVFFFFLCGSSWHKAVHGTQVCISHVRTVMKGYVCTVLLFSLIYTPQTCEISQAVYFKLSTSQHLSFH